MPSILHRLRAVMADASRTREHIHGYIIPSEDAHQSEYVTASDKRRAYMCGFTGSHGTAVVTKDKAAMWTDSRYFIQAAKELYHHWVLMKEGVPDKVTIAEWLSQVLPQGSNIGIDPLYISGAKSHYRYTCWKGLEKELGVAGLHLVALEENLVDLIWTDRPHPSSHTIVPLPIDFSGKLWIEKIYEVRDQMKHYFSGMLVVTALDEVAWLLNLRGSDIEYNPVFFAYVIVTMTSILLFANIRKLSPEVSLHLHSPTDLNCVVTYHPYKHVKKHIHHLAKTVEGKIWISKTSSYALTSLVPKTRRCFSEDSPIAPLKAVKNPTEVSGMRLAHIKDAAALCDFWAWMEKEVPKGRVTELSAAQKLLHYMKQEEDFVGLSFGIMIQSGPHSAAPHYTPTPDTDRPVTVNEIFLCDSGSQYRDGTTDITRVFHFGNPTDYEKECFTAVLKGHIALACTVFPRFTKGCMMDSFARAALWELGLDFRHGTGHGVGAYLNVHEGPTNIVPQFTSQDPGIQAGMTITNEPGYYEEGKFGMRVESVMLVKKVQTKYGYHGDDYLGFEILSLVPIQRKLIQLSMLEPFEIDWLNSYHHQCRVVVGPVLESKGRRHAFEWLIKETELIG